MTVSAWRHIDIAFQTKMNLVFHPPNDEVGDMETAQALQAGHSHATGRRIYGLSPDAIAGVTNDMMLMFVASSRLWQEHFEVVPTGIDQPYWAVTASRWPSFVKQGLIKPTAPPPLQEDPVVDLSKSITQLAQQTQSALSQLLGYHAALSSQLAAVADQVSQLREHPQILEPPQTTEECSAPHLPVSTPPTVGQRGVIDVPSPGYLPPWPTPPAHVPLSPQALDSQAYPPAPPAAGAPGSSSGHWDDAPSHTQPLPALKRPLSDSPSSPAKRPRLDPTSSPAKRPLLDPIALPPLIAPLSGATDMLVPLRKLYGPHATWSDKGQRDAVEAALNLKTDVFALLRTGAGKTAVAVLPALVENGVTVVIVPLISLLEDWRRRLTEWDVPHAIFDSSNPTGLTKCAPLKVVLVSADKSVFSSWKQTLALINNMTPVVRLVLDEGHMWYMDADFRQQAMHLPSTLRIFPMQVVVLSATLPPSMAKALSLKLGMVHHTTIRNHPHRPELKYVIRRKVSGTSDMVNTFQSYLARFKENFGWNTQDRWIVFTSSLATGEQVSKALGVEFYHGDSDNNPITLDTRRDIYARWQSGAHEGLVATSAISVGTDYPHTRLTCHLSPPKDLGTFIQQSSRAGRDGQVAHCLLLSPPAMPPHNSTEDTRTRGVDDMRQLLEDPPLIPGTPPRCVRGGFGRFLEQYDLSCHQLSSDWQACSECEACACSSTYDCSPTHAIPHRH